MPKNDVLFACPVCGRPLSADAAGLHCPNGHRFDRAREGYVNLLPPGHRARTGDSREMVRARRLFLSKGYYAPLASAICAEAAAALADGDVLMDAGCGEGFYTARAAAACPKARAAGFDISRDAVKKAARSCPAVRFAVGSVFRMPVPDASVGLLLSVFAPYSAAEFARTVRPGGRVLAVVPGRRHLFGVKQVVYEQPYENDEAGYTLPGFSLEKSRRLSYSLHLAAPEDIRSLFAMTPYFWKSPREGAARLYGLRSLDTPAEFVLRLYRRQPAPSPAARRADPPA